MYPQPDDPRFALLGCPRRLWMVSAIHADVARLTELHDEIYIRFRPGDRLIYAGNYIGVGEQSAATIDEILTFRRALLAVPGMDADDIVFLRGAQEEMWEKLLQIQFAPNPARTLPEQSDGFWWAGKSFENIQVPYNPFNMVIRGYDPLHGGIKLGDATSTIDGGCGYGGSLVAAGFAANGQALELLEAQ